MKDNTSLNSFNTQSTLNVNNQEYQIFNLALADQSGSLPNVSKLPFSLKILLENCLRHEDGSTVDQQDIKAFSQWLKTASSQQEIAYHPSRVLMQDFTGVPAVVDLAAMRDAIINLGGDGEKINPSSAADLIIDHSVQVDSYGLPQSFRN